jgi:large subunit ribosomal protein L13
MTHESKTQEIKVNVSGMRVGRAATQIAALLLGKNRVDCEKREVADVKVIVENVSELSIPDAKKITKKYNDYSGYPGGLRQTAMKRIIEKFGEQDVLREAVLRMLPRNTLRTKRIKNLIISK